MSGGLGDNGCSISFFCKADEVAGVVAFQVETVFKSSNVNLDFNFENHSNLLHYFLILAEVSKSLNVVLTHNSPIFHFCHHFLQNEKYIYICKYR